MFDVQVTSYDDRYGFRLGDGGEIEAEMFSFAPKFFRVNKAQV
jgi:hypothetical protein